MPGEITEAAAAVRALADALSVTFTANGVEYTSAVKAHWPAPADFDALPAAVVELPEIGRVGVDEPESQLGSRDLNLTFPVTFYFDVGEVVFTQMEAISVLEAFIDAVDASPSLGDPAVVDSKVTGVARPELERDQNRVLLRYEATVEVLKLVP